MPLVRIHLYIPFKRRQDLFHGTSNVGRVIFTWGEEEGRLTDGDIGVISIPETEGGKDRGPGLEGNLHGSGRKGGAAAKEFERMAGIQDVTVHRQHHHP